MSRKLLLLIGVVLTIYCFGCKKKSNDGNNNVQTPTQSQPSITSFTPESAGTGATVTISGANFTGASGVTFGGIAASSFSVTDNNTITAIVGAGATGEVKVITPEGAAVRSGFTFNDKAPIITAMSAANGTTGSVIKLTGLNFTGATAVSFGGTVADAFTVESNTSIVATVGSGASGEIKVTTPDGTAILPGFTYNSAISFARLSNKSGEGTSLGYPRFADRQKSVGTVKISVIFVDFSDVPAANTPQSVFGLVSPTSENFLSTISYGKLNVVFEPMMKWYRMSKPSAAYNWGKAGHDFKGYLQEAVNLADADVDFSLSDQVLVITNPDAKEISYGPAFISGLGHEVKADSRSIINAVASGSDLSAWKGFWFPHEFGHTMGLVDLYGNTGATHRFVGNLSMMGMITGTAPEYNAWERWVLGWINDEQVRSIPLAGTGTVQLTPLETAGGLKMLVLPIDATTAIFVEDRRAIGYDKSIAKEGPFVYLIDTKIGSGKGTLKVLPYSESDHDKQQLALSIGQSVTHGKITVKCIASDAGGSTIEYERK